MLSCSIWFSKILDGWFSWFNAPDDGRMYPKHIELRIHQQNYLVASSWHIKSKDEFASETQHNRAVSAQ